MVLYVKKDLNDRPAMHVCRPFLPVNRAEIRLLCYLEKLPLYPDQTNFDQQTTRSQLRQTVFPLLCQLGFSQFRT